MTGRVSAIGLLGILALLLAVVGCGLSAVQGDSPTVPASVPSAAQAPVEPASALPDFVAVVAKVRPSVVAIDTRSTRVSFFGRRVVEKGAGSGWVIDGDGLVVTNGHVVDGADSVSVTLEDGRSFPAQSVQIDAAADLALLRIDARGLPALEMGDSSKLQVGQWVVAVGNSLGLGISATKGIVSALGVILSPSARETLGGLIQTDAAINPGNSGGPLVNLRGQVVGINSAKVSQVGVEGMGYAIGINEAKPVLERLGVNP